MLDAGTASGSDTADTGPDRLHTRDTALHSQTANRYTSSPWMVLSAPLLCSSGLDTVWRIQGNHPTGFVAFTTNHKIRWYQKISNLIFDALGHAVGIIDFDTILRHARAIDLGDAFRSWCNRTAEDDPDATFDVAFFEAAASGYAEGSGMPSGPQERARHLRATKQITLELATRFLLDVVHDTYFGFDAARYPHRRAHNMARARGQYHLAQTIPYP